MRDDNDVVLVSDYYNNDSRAETRKAGSTCCTNTY